MFSRNKEKINMLMNINNYFGEHQGRLAPILMFLLATAAPFLLYTVTISRFVKLRYMLIFEVFWAIRMALFFLGHENQKLAQYKKDAGYDIGNEEKEDNNVYESANDLVRVSNVSDDGLIEYVDGRIAYIVSGYLMSYMDDVPCTQDFEVFIRQFRGYDYDIFCQMVADEYRLQDSLEKMRVYKDRDVMYERMQFYQCQDEFCKKNTKLYRICIVIKASKYDWKILRDKLRALVASEYANVFFSVELCDKRGVNDVMSRDICANIDLYKMLVEKYKNDEFYESEVLFYGDEVPDEYKPKRDKVNLQNRRVVIRKEE